MPPWAAGAAGTKMGGMMHGGQMRMMGDIAAVPNLYGQHAACTMQQLGAFAKGRSRPL